MKKFISIFLAICLMALITPFALSANLSGFTGLSGTWSFPNTTTADGQGSGDCFAMSNTTSSTNFIYSADVTFRSGTAASLVFRSSNDAKTCYVANIDRSAGTARIFKFTNPGDANVGLVYHLPDSTKDKYNIRVEVIGSKMRYFVDGVLAVVCEDTQFSSGRFGLLNYNANVLYENLTYTNVSFSGSASSHSARLTGLTGLTGFSTSTYTYELDVPFETDSINLTPTVTGTNVIKYNGQTVSGQINVPLAEGKNDIIFETFKGSDRGMTTVVKIRREADPDKYYYEKYRPQWHVTPPSGWLNDPNGMVYYKGQWHLFYQHDPNTKYAGLDKWWGHVVSDDLVNWEHRPIALSPDIHGSIFSGSAIVDVNNDSGLFGSVGGQGLIAYYTSHANNGNQRQCMAYSLDDGETWIKYNGGAPIIGNSLTEDPLNVPRDFRDPKVFWHEESGKWMMVVAGGPLRFYSSANLINWTAEGMQNEIWTECPDFFQLSVNGGAEKKWVLTNSGVTYMIGEFSNVSGKWKFVPDSMDRYDMNFGPDSYAMQTFSDTPDGRRIKIDWMVDLGYAGRILDITDPWTQALTMPYEVNLIHENGRYSLTQTPVEEMNALRDGNGVVITDDVTVSPEDGNIYSDIRLESGVMKAEIDVSDGGGFLYRLRAGNGQHTDIKYSPVSGLLTVDRANSGAMPFSGFGSAFSASVKPIDGKISLEVFIDWGSIEVFANGGRAVCTALIYPDRESDGIEFYAVGGDVTVKHFEAEEFKSIWRPEGTPVLPEPSEYKLSAAKTDVLVGDSLTVWVSPATDKEVKWTVPDDGIVEVIESSDGGTTLKAVGAGSAVISAEFVPTGAITSLTINVQEDGFNTNLTGLSALSGSWEHTAEGYKGISGNSNGSVFAGNSTADFAYTGTVKFGSADDVAAAMIFRTSDDLSSWYSVDLNIDQKQTRLLKFTRDPVTGSTSDEAVSSTYSFTESADNTYTIKILGKGSTVRIWVNGAFVFSGSTGAATSGRFGLNVYGSTTLWNDVYAVTLGDSDIDGTVTAADALAALKDVVNIEKLSGFNKDAADMDINGSISILDARAILLAAVQ